MGETKISPSLQATETGSDHTFAWNNVVLPPFQQQQHEKLLTWKRPLHVYSHEVSHLVSETLYEAQVQAKNKFGWSERSEALQFSTVRSVDANSRSSRGRGSCFLTYVIMMMLTWVSLSFMPLSLVAPSIPVPTLTPNLVSPPSENNFIEAQKTPSVTRGRDNGKSSSSTRAQGYANSAGDTRKQQSTLQTLHILMALLTLAISHTATQI